MSPGSFRRRQDHQVGKSGATFPVSERCLGYIVRCFDHETLGRHQLFQYRRNPVAGIAIGPLQPPNELNRRLPGTGSRAAGR